MSAHGAKHKMMSLVGFHGIMIIFHSHEYVQSDESLQHDKSKSIYVQLDDILFPDLRWIPFLFAQAKCIAFTRENIYGAWNGALGCFSYKPCP